MVGKLAMLTVLAGVCCQSLKVAIDGINNEWQSENQLVDVDVTSETDPPSLVTGAGSKLFPNDTQREEQREREKRRIKRTTKKRRKKKNETKKKEENNPQSLELANLINQYRAENGLPAIPISNSLMKVATLHVKDSQIKREPQCNLHSWSSNGDGAGVFKWTPCCYTADHAQAKCMWSKPREITRFPGDGFEISAYSRPEPDPKKALSQWQRSIPHNNVILNKGTWAGKKWQALGAAIGGNYAHAWFSDVADKASRKSFFKFGSNAT